MRVRKDSRQKEEGAGGTIVGDGEFMVLLSHRE